MDVYFADLPGVRVLGPYSKDEIQPQLRARRLLGWPERNVLYIEASSIEAAREKARQAASRHSFYVKRERDGRTGWTGPIRGAAQAGREVTAWQQAGWAAEYVLSSATVRAQVRAWEKESKSMKITEPAPDQVEAAAAEIAVQITAAARGSGDDPIVFVTGNSYMPPLRSFAAAEQVYQADEDGEDFGRLQELVEARLAEADVALECPEYDNALYAVDLQRFEYVDDPGDHETLQQDWQPKGCCPDCTTGEKS